MRKLLAMVFAFGLLLPPAVADEGDPVTQSIMHGIFAPISQLLPLSFDDEAFRATEHRAEITKLLKELSDHAGVLDQHAKSKDRAFQFVASSLQADAKRAYLWYTRGDYAEALFTVHNMTENCLACHSGLPEAHKVPPAAAFFKAVKVDTLHPLERAQYYVMSRQFDTALTTYEAYFTQGDVPAASLPALGAFADYLKICISVKQELKRPQKLIEAVLRRPEVSTTAREQLSRWSQSLAELDKQGALSKNSLEDARQLLAQGRDHMEFPQDRDGVVYYLVASALLTRYVHNHPDYGQDVGEAYYMLGITESLLGHSFWVSRSEFYLESAIRLAPNTPFAHKALALLEQNATEFGGKDTHAPEDANSLLNDLRGLSGSVPGGKGM